MRITPPPRIATALMTCGLAAGMLLLAACQNPRDDSTVHSTAVGEYKRVRMPGGIELALNTNSRVSTRVERGSRVLEVEQGELLLNVAGSSRYPSVLRLGDLELETVSATVHVRWEPDGSRRFEMLSGEGNLRSTRFDASTTARRRFLPLLLLESGQAFRAHGDVLGMEFFDRTTVDRRLAWTRGEVLLRGETLAEAITEFNRYNDRKLIISDGTIASLRIGGRFDATDIDAFVRSLHDVFGIKVVSDRPATGRAAKIVLVGSRARRV
jgi:transmembrane sensor